MIKKISRKKALLLYPLFPQSDHQKDIYFFPESYNSYILTLEARSLRGLNKNLSISFAQLIYEIGFEELIFLGDSKYAWLSQQNDYKPAKSAIRFFEENKVTKKFNGALIVSAGSLTVFIQQLFWLIRCNVASPYIYFMNKDQTIAGTICQYGSLHINVLNKSAEKDFKKAISNTAFRFSTLADCFDKFKKKPGIAGRTAAV